MIRPCEFCTSSFPKWRIPEPASMMTGLLSSSNLKFNPADAEIWEVWDEVVGPSISEHAQPSNITKKLLRVYVSEPIWLQELEFVAETIKDKLKNYRKSGLEKDGELSYENLVFKFLRRSGHIQKLFDKANKETDKELSIETQIEE